MSEKQNDEAVKSVQDKNELKDVKSSIISDYFIKSNFRETFKDNKRIKGMFTTDETFPSIILTAFILVAFSLLYFLNNKDYSNLTSNLVIGLIGGYISLIAFSLAALTLNLSFMNNKEIYDLTEFELNCKKEINIKNKELLQTYRDISFRFYHSAVFNLVSIFLLIGLYVYMNIPLNFHVPYCLFIILNYLLGLIVVYIIVYSLIFNITLINDCIKVKFSNFDI